MRSIRPDFLQKLKDPIQTQARQTDPRLSLWISRPTTQLTTWEFLEHTAVAPGGSAVSRVSIAVRHRRFGRVGDRVFVGYISGGIATVVSSPYCEDMSQHRWAAAGFSSTATDIALCFDGTMPRDTKNRYEFITESVPWVFRIDGGAVYGSQLGDHPLYTLAERNATAITAVRAMWSEVPDFDFGLVLFMILNGSIFYRSYIKGVWSNAEPIPANALPSGLVWSQISAQRTWDYRVVLQAIDTTGGIYEIFTQYGGLGSKSAEHIEVRDIRAQAALTAIMYHKAESLEHIEVSNITVGAPYGGLYDIGVPTLIGARNFGDSGGNFGKNAEFVFDIHVNPDEVAANAAAFQVIDTRGTAYTATRATLGKDGQSVSLTFANFNAAQGVCKATYTPGTVTSMAGTILVKTEYSFTPIGLVPPLIRPPKIMEAVNV